MPKSRTAAPSSPNVTASHSDDVTRHIPDDECDAANIEITTFLREQRGDPDPDLDLAFSSRVLELLGDETRVSFAKGCRFSEGALRKYLKGYRPGRDNLVAMADYKNVSVEWLATGIPPKERTRRVQYQKAESEKGTVMPSQDSAAPGGRHHDGQINAELLRLCLLTCKQVFGGEFSNALITIQLQYAVDFYNQLVLMANTKGPRTDLDAFCSLDSGALAEQLRFFVKMGWARNFPADAGDRPRSGPGLDSWS